MARWSIHAVEALAADAVPLARGADHARGLCAEPIATRLGARTIEARVARLDAHARDAVEPWLAPTATAWIGVARRTHGRDHGAHALLAHRNLAGAAGETALRRRAATRWTALAASPEQWDQQSESESNVGHAPAHQIEWTRRFCERQAREVCRDVCFLRRRCRVVDATTVRAHACARWSVPILVS